MKDEAFQKLSALLREIIPANRFQSARLARISDITSLADFTARVPFTTKAELVADQSAHPPHGTNLTFPLKRYTRFCQTSGTTARPLAILDTTESWDWMLGNWERIYREAGVVEGDCVYFAFSFGPFLGFWTAFEAAAKLGFLCIPGGGLTSAARIHALLEHRATVLLCTPTYALHLAEVAARESLPLRKSSVCKIIVAGEPGGSVPTIRARISSAWNGAEVIDHYGMTETGPVAFQRSGEEGILHVIEESYFCEVIDPKTGAPAADGEAGELVVTPLGRAANPLLRYRTGDLVRRGTAPGFSLAGGILGRSDDMIVVRGVNVFPSAVDAVVRGVSEITEYRVTVNRQGEMAELAVEVETDDDTAAHRLQTALGETFALRIPVAKVPSGTLPRFELKARRWRR
jgi:phenylacetate-CoA ligase